MNVAIRRGVCFLLLIYIFIPAAWAQNVSISGTVTDASDDNPLVGANIVVRLEGSADIAGGAASDVDGFFRIENLDAGEYTITVSFLGYQEYRSPISFSAGESRTLNVALQPGGLDLNAVIITASRQQEKALDAPASISVLSAREIEGDVSPSTVDVLRYTPGVDIAQTGIDRRELVLRGFNNAFSGATYVLTDYRHAAVPSLAANIYSVMPTASVDIDRIEVVRGPGSALYGAGVDAGVVHFFTKDPFTHPGTTISIGGGQRSMLSGQFRHAGVIGGNFGYKVTGKYSRAEDWKLLWENPEDAVQLLGDARPRIHDYETMNFNGMLQYRVNDDVTLTLNGGHSTLTGTVLSGIGTLYADGFGYSYGQFRVQAGNFFGQVYVNRNDAGDSGVYDTGMHVVDYGTKYNMQAQYDLTFANGRQQFIFGVDVELLRPDTEGTILGRNEDSDAIDEYGTYVQSTTRLTSQLDLTAGIRGDYNNIVEEIQLSPRVALVYKPTPEHSLRASFNRAFSSSATNQSFLDIVARQPDATLPITVRGRGSAYGYTFDRNHSFGALAGSDLVASSLIPNMEGQPMPIGLLLNTAYDVLHSGLKSIPTEQLTAILQANGIPIDAATTGLLVDLLSPAAGTTVTGFSRGQMALLNLTTLGLDPVNDVVDVAPLKPTTSQTIEVGYKGVFEDRVLLAVDAYYTTKKNFVGPLVLETPFVLVPNLSSDLTAAIASGIAGNAPLAGALGMMGLTPEAVAGLMVGLAADQLPSATTPIGIVQPQENNPGVGPAPELLLTYRNYGDIAFWGTDISTQVIVNDQLDLFGNFSYVSDDLFEGDELGEGDTDLKLALNATTVKVKGGFNYSHSSGLSFNAAGRYTKGFPVRSGPYVGELDDYFLLDVGFGFDFSQYAPGLRFDMTVQNILNNNHREFIGAPLMGRMGMIRITFTF